ncbi:tetrathionate reductase family octaheme c-type cytochrome [Paenirhodobacter sp. CAU 1674]|uniref:tetrathionate reductase family octaheme c-type cytochrome n=1 Tax=Paenirhodobacter sp. CAU 1674 TaxID=3032596 RepID=UPI0023DC560B|nr:tetrathionate reductase family octaheme c-type cytochrome [Paenirhodobacter sp. CAU 1674]MDF2139935.1 tetrathionate reductase family octaheme c-type cytochrome [Paenirhodobacter sp. CAU 1674]
MRQTALRITAIVWAVVLGGGGAVAQDTAAPAEQTPTGAQSMPAPGALAAHMSDPVKELTADHAKFEILKGPFASGPEVTAACLSCHTEASNQVMHSVHWKWEYDNPATGQTLGKAKVLNAFCGNVASNEVRCTSCHTGYDWVDVRQPMPDDPTKVDCLVCHDTSGQYAKQDNTAGNPPLDPVDPKAKTITGADAWAVDLAKAALSVGPPSRENCGNCHFYGGGGDNVKHGDLSSALFDPSRAVDVHMSKDGANFTCEACHVSDKHVLAGSRYTTDVALPDDAMHKPGAARDVAACTSCHTDQPHKGPNPVIGMKLNDHTDKVACQTCHIPEFARGGVATKTWWDWSTAGKLKDGKGYSEEEFVQSDGKHLHTYLSTKGDFKWGENVVPYYAWSNGVMTYTLPETTIDPTQVVEINSIGGEAGAKDARIFPFKRMEGKQAYDTERNVLLYNHVYGPGDGTALWSYFDWEKSLKAGMDYVGLEYSGKFDFVETHMYWPITHMVAPKEDALKCESCHSEGGRMANIAGIYVPGSGIGIGGKLGLVVFLMALLGVVGHGVLRLFGKKGDHHG